MKMQRINETENEKNTTADSYSTADTQTTAGITLYMVILLKNHPVVI